MIMEGWSMMQYIAIVFILLISFAVWKILQLLFRLLKKGIKTVTDAITVNHYEREC